MKLTAVFEPCEEGGFMAFIEEIPGVITQGETIEETAANLEDALELVMDVNREIAEEALGKDAIRQTYVFNKVGNEKNRPSPPPYQ